jgi:hypothetical protein
MLFPKSDNFTNLQNLTARRIAILDEAMGTMIQQLDFGEAEFRGKQFADHPRDLKGCNDLLSITQPDAITAIHRAFLEAGADIISTNTFNANAISMADYGLVDRVREINAAAVACAKNAIEQFRRVRETHQDSRQWAVGGGQKENGAQGSGFRIHPSSLIPHPSSLILHPSSLILYCRVDRPDQPHGFDVAGCERPGLSGRNVRSACGGILRAGGGARRSRGRYPPARNHL